MVGTSGSSTVAHIGPQNADATDLPRVVALFLIKFDQKVGYAIAWKRALPGVELEGAVEFKSLPSGLHSVKDDLVYFVHDEYAGLSAFINGPGSAAERNAHMVAVGILVPLSYGRLGRSWLHADMLNELASKLVEDASKTELLEKYWDTWNAASNSGSSLKKQPDSPTYQSTRPGPTGGHKGHNRIRALSSVTAVLPSDQALPSSHPALSILDYIDTFGPLVFPLQRAALLRKRILFIAPPSVRRLCEFVYDLSILSSIPSSITHLLSPATESYHRLRSFFSIGVHDIPLLEKEAIAFRAALESENTDDSPAEFPFQGWVACTTDEIIKMKTKLYDIIVEVPPVTEHAPQRRQWPRVTTSSGLSLKASHRDLRRWKLLYHELSKVRTGVQFVDGDNNADSYHDDPDASEHINLLTHISSRSSTSIIDDSDAPYEDTLIEPITWSQLAYSGFLWWASAGERDASQSDDYDVDYAALGDLSDFIPFSNTRPSPHRKYSRGDSGLGNGDYLASSTVSVPGIVTGVHTAVIAYFHRLTTSIITTLAELVDVADDAQAPSASLPAFDSDNDEDSSDKNEELPVNIDGEDLKRMGLDAWSAADREFVAQLCQLYFGREAKVNGAGIECCGMRVC